jgi:acyl-CoA dehydrogenase
MMPSLHRHSWMDDETEAFRSQVRRYAREEMAPHVDEWRRQGYAPREVWRPLGELGYLLPELPSAYGGSDASVAWQIVLQEELARAEAPPSLTVHAIVAHYILAHGTEQQKLRWLPLLASGEHLAGIAMSEPAGGSDLKALTTRAKRDGDHYVLNGSKIFISNGATASLLAVACRTGDAGSKGISLILVETENQPGFRVGRRLEKLGMDASDTAEIFFDGVRVPASNLLGEVEGLGFKQMMTELPFERALLIPGAIASIELALELTLEYAKQRKMFNQTLFDFQNTKFKLAEIATIAHVARTFANDCIQRLADGEFDPQAAYMAKLWLSEQQCHVVDECLQLFGGYGYMKEYRIARLYADARPQRIYAGTSEVMKDLIARQL